MPKAPKTPRSKHRTLPIRCRSQIEDSQQQPFDRHLSDISNKVNSPLPREDEMHRTHPRGFDNHHAKNLKTFVHDLAGSLTYSFPAKDCPYPAVYVVLLRWVEDNLGVQSEITKLRRIFESQFNFEVEEWHIPTSNPYEFLEDKIFHFKKAHQNESDLLIVYYGGHAGQDLRRGRSIWYAHPGNESPSLNWYNLQPMLLEANPHVLIILDCCFAANAARDTSFGTAKELLAACGGESETPGVCDLSFTSVLVEELQYLGRTSFTVAMLFSRLVTMRHKLKGTPIYVPLSEHGSNSITIAPMPKSLPPDHNQEGSDRDGITPSDKARASPDENRPLYQSPPASASSSNFAPLPPNRPETRVLLSVSVSEDIGHDTAQWVRWLTTGAPWDVTKIDVAVEGIFRSHSTLVLVSIPIIAWTQLAETAAYQFIGFVQSANLYHQPGYKPIMEPTICTKRKRTNSDLNDSDGGTPIAYYTSPSRRCKELIRTGSPAKRRRNPLLLTPP